MANRNYSAFYVSEPFSETKLGAYSAKDFVYYNMLRAWKRVSKKYLAPSIYSYPYWRLKSNIRFYKGVFCLFGHPLS